jgi:urease accessory protein
MRTLGIIHMGANTADALTGTALLRLLQLTSPALPIGTFAYSQGLEPAVEAGAVHDEPSARAWILGLLEQALGRVEVPVLRRLHAAWQTDDLPAVRRWNEQLLAMRGAAELQAEDRRLGDALGRVLQTLGFDELPWKPVTHLAAFTRASSAWNIPIAPASEGFLFSWAEAQVGAASRLVPLGQSAAQRILDAAIALIPTVVQRGLALSDDEIGATAPAHALGSARHETQYSRIFRS